MKTGEMEKIQNGHRNFPLGITKTEKGIHICTVALELHRKAKFLRV